MHIEQRKSRMSDISNHGGFHSSAHRQTAHPTSPFSQITATCVLKAETAAASSLAKQVIAEATT
jgi:hypothetical protein